MKTDFGYTYIPNATRTNQPNEPHAIVDYDGKTFFYSIDPDSHKEFETWLQNTIYAELDDVDFGDIPNYYSIEYSWEA